MWSSNYNREISFDATIVIVCGWQVKSLWMATRCPGPRRACRVSAGAWHRGNQPACCNTHVVCMWAPIPKRTGHPLQAGNNDTIQPEQQWINNAEYQKRPSQSLSAAVAGQHVHCTKQPWATATLLPGPLLKSPGTMPVEAAAAHCCTRLSAALWQVSAHLFGVVASNCHVGIRLQVPPGCTFALVTTWAACPVVCRGQFSG